ncbi:Type I secretion system ATP-binding protein PrsD [compost metagenome]
MDLLSSPRSELAETLFRLRRTFYALAAFSGVINLLMLTPAVYMLQVYDRALVSSNVTTLLMLTLLVVGLYILMGMLEMVRSSVLIRVGNRLDMMLNQRVFTAAFERNLRRAGGNPSQALQDLSQVRQFLTGNGLFAFFDAPWTPIYLVVISLVHPLLGVITLIGSLLLVGLAWLTETMPPAPTPCSTRASTSCSMFCASAQKIEARVKSAVPVRIIRRRPYRSPSLP